MSLLNDAFETCVSLSAVRQSDGMGGYETVWVEGAEFPAAIVQNNSLQAKIAEQQGVTSTFTVTTRKDVTLHFHEVFRRKRDGKIFRVTSDGDETKTPASAGLNMRQVSAEAWKLVN